MYFVFYEWTKNYLNYLSCTCLGMVILSGEDNVRSCRNLQEACKEKLDVHTDCFLLHLLILRRHFTNGFEFWKLLFTYNLTFLLLGKNNFILLKYNQYHHP